MRKKSQWNDILGYIVRQNKQYLNAKASTKPTEEPVKDWDKIVVCSISAKLMVNYVTVIC